MVHLVRHIAHNDHLQQERVGIFCDMRVEEGEMIGRNMVATSCSDRVMIGLLSRGGVSRGERRWLSTIVLLSPSNTFTTVSASTKAWAHSPDCL